MNRAVELITRLSIDRASQVLSKMVRAGAKIVWEEMNEMDVAQLTERVSSEGDAVMGALIDLAGDIDLKFLCFLPERHACTVTDMILQKEIGTTREINELVRGAVQEIGNILASAVCNVFVSDFQIHMRPSPPMFVHDFQGSIFEEYLIRGVGDRNEIYVIETKFWIVRLDIPCSMYLVPAGGAKEMLMRIC